MPLNGTLNVGLNAIVTLTFSEPLSPNTVNGSTFALFANRQHLSQSDILRVSAGEISNGPPP